MTNWKCEKCGYSFKAEKLPEKCPGCKEKCTFLDNTDYTQNIGKPRPDERI